MVGDQVDPRIVEGVPLVGTGGPRQVAFGSSGRVQGHQVCFGILALFRLDVRQDGSLHRRGVLVGDGAVRMGQEFDLAGSGIGQEDVGILLGGLVGGIRRSAVAQDVALRGLDGVLEVHLGQLDHGPSRGVVQVKAGDREVPSRVCPVVDRTAVGGPGPLLVDPAPMGGQELGKVAGADPFAGQQGPFVASVGLHPDHLRRVVVAHHVEDHVPAVG